ncbi:Metallo-dependent phosphatase-like protein [Paraphysoderma sedebokerense]|nr:Metallo-dependent phosphatase-like protein [Paraphysoderma sedebokerense]
MSTLQLLHVTDVHYQLANLEKLTEWIKVQGKKIDAVLLSGDLLNIFHPLEADNQFMKGTKEDFNQFNDIIVHLKNIATRVFYIPGNHDPIELFNGEFGSSKEVEQLVQGTNVHGDVVEIAPDLFIAGIGGSVDAFNNLNGDLVWPGCPYNDFSFKERLTVILNQADEAMAKKSSETSRPSLILMTHNGPKCSTTEINKRPFDIDGVESTQIQSGSVSLYNFLASKERQTDNKILINIHGHSHYSYSLTRIGNIPIFNPGPMENGRFGIIHLSYDDVDSRLNEEKKVNYPSHSVGIKRWKIVGTERWIV